MAVRSQFTETVTAPMGTGGSLVPVSGIGITVYNVNADGSRGSQVGPASLYQDRTGSAPASLATDSGGTVSFWADPGEYEVDFSDQQSPPRIPNFTRGFASIPYSTAQAIASNQTPPIGLITAFGGTADPQDSDGTVRWLICNGRAISRSQYQTLFGVIGTEYGAGDGSTTFNIPNLESRVPVGAGQGSGLSNYGIGTSGGEETHSLAMGEMPQHFHTIVDPGHAHDITASVTDNGHTHSLGSPPDATHYDVAVNPGGAAWAAQHFPIGQPSDPIGIYNNNFANQNINGTLSSLTGISVAASSDLKYALGAANVNTLLAGNNLPHNNIQPYLVVSFIIKVV